MNVQSDPLRQEEKLRQLVGDFSYLLDRRNKTEKPLPLVELERRIEAGEFVDRHDIGGCACAIE